MASSKKKVVDLSTTNLCNFGTDLEKNVKQASAQAGSEWKIVDRKPGLLIWRIEDFKVVEWPKNQYGEFYSDDSYIVLHTHASSAKSDVMLFDIYFWLGSTTSPDEAGTAAYKTVELDNYLGGSPIEHREVCESESPAFLSLFPQGIRILKGGVQTGFRHVKPTEYKPRLLQLKGTANRISVRERPLECASLNSGDVFIVDNGLTLYTWIGKSANKFEQGELAKLTRAFDDERGGKVEVINFREGDNDPRQANMFKLLSGSPKDIKTADQAGADSQVKYNKRLFRLSDASGTMKFEPITPIAKSKLTSKDVFILDVDYEVFVWVGKQASANEKTCAMKCAMDYLLVEKRPKVPLTRLLDGAEAEIFYSFFS